MGHIRHELKTIGWPRSKHKEGQEATILMKVQGWEALSPVAGTAVAGKCFVAMSFDPSLTSAYEQGMIPAIVQDCKFSVERLDRVEHNESINDRILAGIRGSQFTVADFTFQRPNVYFEAGFALALGRTVIWTCRETDAENLQFDTRQMNYIRWADPQDLRSKLTPRILATVALPFRAAQR